MADETKQVDVIMGPYRNSRLTMTTADADAAINGHWAIEPITTYDPDHEHHDPLTDQQRTDALAAAHTWAQAQWDAAQGTTPPPEPPPEGGEGGITRRAMKPEDQGEYKTREAQETRHPDPRRPEHQKR
jgi:hypothetical protein